MDGQSLKSAFLPVRIKILNPNRYVILIIFVFLVPSQTLVCSLGPSLFNDGPHLFDNLLSMSLKNCEDQEIKLLISYK